MAQPTPAHPREDMQNMCPESYGVREGYFWAFPEKFYYNEE
jgi:hypothetical protein